MPKLFCVEIFTVDKTKTGKSSDFPAPTFDIQLSFLREPIGGFSPEAELPSIPKDITCINMKILRAFLEIQPTPLLPVSTPSLPIPVIPKLPLPKDNFDFFYFLT